MNKNNDLKNISLLFDSYGPLLTDRQREIFKMNYFEDMTLQEIADDLSISKPGVKDSIDTSVEALEKYESLLGVISNKEKLRKILESNDDSETKVKKIMKLEN